MQNGTFNFLKIKFALEKFKEESVNEKFRINIYRIVQEQLNNILKHARASDVCITLLQSTRSIRLSITDNGVGFDTGKNQNGIGLANIKSRAAIYNGAAIFTSQPGKGCVLKVEFPLVSVNRK